MHVRRNVCMKRASNVKENKQSRDSKRNFLFIITYLIIVSLPHACPFLCKDCKSMLRSDIVRDRFIACYIAKPFIQAHCSALILFLVDRRMCLILSELFGRLLTSWPLTLENDWPSNFEHDQMSLLLIIISFFNVT